MSNTKFPEKITEHGKEFNRVSWADAEKLGLEDRQKYVLIEKQEKAELKKIKADNERYREKRIEKEIDRLLRKPAPGLSGPAPVLGGRRIDRPEGVARDNLSPEQLRKIRETAVENVRKADEAHLHKIEQAFTQAQRDVLDRALGQNRYPSRGR